MQIPIKINDKILKRFWNKVDIKGENECWLWKGAKTEDNYFKKDSKCSYANPERHCFLIMSGN